jgi:hypothetical protein
MSITTSSNPSTPQRRHHLGLLLVLSAFCRIVKGSGGKHYLEHGYHGLDLSADGSFEAVGLTHNQWKNASCSPNGFRDFYIDATSANAHDNLFVEAVHVPTDENDVKVINLHYTLTVVVHVVVGLTFLPC